MADIEVRRRLKRQKLIADAILMERAVRAVQRNWPGLRPIEMDESCRNLEDYARTLRSQAVGK